MCTTITAEASVSLEQAAKMLGTTPMNILMHLKHKLIQGTEVDGQWAICAESLNAFSEKNQGSDKTLCKKHTCQHSACGSCE